MRHLKITIDGFPGRRNSLQQQVYDEWLAARDRLTNIDQSMNNLRLRIRQIDEQVLMLTEKNLKRPFPTNRRDIQMTFKMVEEGCSRVFSEVKTQADEVATESGITRDRAVQNAMATLGSKAQIESEYGSTALFMQVFKQYCSGKQVFSASNPKPKATPKAKARAKR